MARSLRAVSFLTIAAVGLSQLGCGKEAVETAAKVRDNLDEIQQAGSMAGGGGQPGGPPPSGPPAGGGPGPGPGGPSAGGPPGSPPAGGPPTGGGYFAEMAARGAQNQQGPNFGAQYGAQMQGPRPGGGGPGGPPPGIGGPPPGIGGPPGFGGPPGVGGPPGSPQNAVAAPTRPTDLKGLSQWAFGRGKESEANQLLLGHLVAEGDDAEEMLNLVKFSGQLREPRWTLRWGVGLDTDYDGDPMPIREGMSAPSSGGRGFGGPGGGGDEPTAGGGGFGPGGPSGGRAGGGSSPSAEFNRYTGQWGSSLLEGFSSRFANGDFGSAFVGVTLAPPEAAPNAGFAGGFRPGGGAPGAGGPSGAGSGPPPGIGGPPPGFGGPPPGIGGPPPGIGGPPPGVGGPPRGPFAGAGPGGAGGGQSAASAAAGEMLAPGLVYLGKDKWKDLLADAKKRGLDYLAVFSIDVNKNAKTGYVTNETKLNVYDVASGEMLIASKKLNNVNVFRASQSGDSPTKEVDKALDPVWKLIDDKLALQDLPNLTREQVAGRVAQLLASDSDQPLQELAEIRAYYGRGLMNDEELTKAYDMLVGDQGLVLITGSSKERRKAVDAWMPTLD